MKKVICIIIFFGLSFMLFIYVLKVKSNSNFFFLGIIILFVLDFIIECVEDYFFVLEVWLEDFGGVCLVINDCDVDDNVEWDYGLINYEVGCGGVEIYMVIFIVINNCGDVIGIIVFFFVEDNSGFEIYVLLINIFYNCSNLLLVVWVFDECVEIEFIENVSFYEVDYCNGFFVSYNWVVIDDCGNIIILSKVYMVVGDNMFFIIIFRNNLFL